MLMSENLVLLKSSEHTSIPKWSVESAGLFHIGFLVYFIAKEFTECLIFKLQAQPLASSWSWMEVQGCLSLPLCTGHQS